MPINKKLRQVVFRINAGNLVGMGHLSRCLSLAYELQTDFGINFLIKSDSQNKVSDFIKSRMPGVSINSIIYLSPKISQSDDLNQIKKLLFDLNNAFLIIDHYDANYEYQSFLSQNKIKWLQFDSHGKIDFLADLVLHGSPGATPEIYFPHKINERTKFLLGPKYAIVNSNFRLLNPTTKPRTKIKTVFMCLGGGDDNGALLKCVNFFNDCNFANIKLNIVFTETNKDIEILNDLAATNSNLKLRINSKVVHKLMVTSDLAIIPPGTLSYEAASVGLPMLLITLASNQEINAKGWTAIGAGISLGSINKLKIEVFKTSLDRFIQMPKLLNEMSKNCFKAVDGNGTIRTKEQILSII